jgi:hypothetical protein
MEGSQWIIYTYIYIEGGAVSHAPSLAGARFSLLLLDYYWT